MKTYVFRFVLFFLAVYILVAPILGFAGLYDRNQFCTVKILDVERVAFDRCRIIIDLQIDHNSVAVPCYLLTPDAIGSSVDICYRKLGEASPCLTHGINYDFHCCADFSYMTSVRLLQSWIVVIALMISMLIADYRYDFTKFSTI